MTTLDEIMALPQSDRGAAWLLLQKHPTYTLGQLAKLAKSNVAWQDKEHRLTDATLPVIARDILDTPLEAPEMPLVASSPIVDLMIAVLGATLAGYLADGHTQSECARKLGVAHSGVAKRIARARLLCGSKNNRV